jgi:hypothetical protein
MRWILLLVAVFAFLTVGVQSANACSCGGGGAPCESYGGAAAVFVGTVIGYSENRLPKEVARKEVDWSPRIFKFSVEQSYLGVEGSEIEVSTGTGGGDCGYEFKTGQRYLVYAYRYTERLTTSICTRTRLFIEANEDLAFLGNLSSAAPGATIHGGVTPEKFLKGEKNSDDPDVSITIVGENERKEIRPDAQGRYRLSGLRPGKFKVTLNLPDTLTVYQAEQVVTVADRGCANVSYFIAENGRVSGRVFDVDGQPVAKIPVSLVKPESVDPTNYVKLVSTDDDGRYSFSGVPSGRYVIAINHSQFTNPTDATNAYPRAFYPGVIDRPHAEIITLESGARVVERDVRLPPRNSSSIVDVQVEWADGTPVTSTIVSVRDVTYKDSSLSYGIEADEHGRFKINGYIGQKLFIDARSNRTYVPSGSRFEPMERSSPVRITLEKPAHLVKIVITKLR